MKREVGDRGYSTALQEIGFHSHVEKKPKIKKEEKYKEEPASECFVCRGCLEEIAGAYDILTTVDFQMNGIAGLFRRVSIFTVEREQSADPGFDVFIVNVFCFPCSKILGSLIIRGEHSGNYVIPMNCLWIKRGIFLFDAVTRDLVAHIP